MNWFLVFILVSLVGYFTGQFWLVLLGLALALLSIIKVNPNPRKSPSGGRSRHKLIQAPEDAWEDNDWALFAYQLAPMPLGIDVFKEISEKTGKEIGEIPAGTLRRLTPWPNYGESSAIQQMMAGMILPLDNWFFKKTYEAKFKGKWKGKEGETFVFGREKEAEEEEKEGKSNKK